MSRDERMFLAGTLFGAVLAGTVFAIRRMADDHMWVYTEGKLDKKD